jgi:acyl-CoA synthetase (AMP-forming)/AMP-acid ligase II
MLGLMQHWPLLISKVIDHAASQFGDQEIVSRLVEGPIHRETYRDLRRRALQLAKSLNTSGITSGDRIATLAWNTHRHLELWYGITGLGGIYHTVNPRLFDDQIVYIINHAEDRMLFLDLTFVPLVERIAPRLHSIERFVILTDTAHMPDTALKNATAYEDFIAQSDEDFIWAEFDENTAAGLCYTSGTTGHPKGVLYSHRSNVLHAMAHVAPDFFNISSHDSVMPVVPLFHANSWSLGFSAPMVGARMVMPGGKLDGPSLHELLEQEGVTMTAAVPTVWLALLDHLNRTQGRLTTLKRVAIGGSACPRAMTEAFEKNYGVTVAHAWGMTEMSPLGSFCSIKPALKNLDDDALYSLKMKQGFPAFTVEMKITDDSDHPLPHDGKTFGRLKVRGPAVAKQYFGYEENILDAEGFFDTGDVATIDAHGYMHITDRSKDVIKSGGEWISSIELENLAVGHPAVAEAAVIGVAHPKWDERPLLIIVRKKDMTLEREEILRFFEGKIAKWWMPDDVVFVDEIPHTATGKIQKTALRDQFAGHQLPTA